MTERELVDDKARVVNRAMDWLLGELRDLKLDEDGKRDDGERLLKVLSLYQGCRLVGFCADAMFAAATEGLSEADRGALQQSLLEQLTPLVEEFQRSLG